MVKDPANLDALLDRLKLRLVTADWWPPSELEEAVLYLICLNPDRTEELEAHLAGLGRSGSWLEVEASPGIFDNSRGASESSLPTGVGPEEKSILWGRL